MTNEIFFNTLKDYFPDAECELKFNSDFELLVDVILSAQCTDKRVNEVTEKLYKKANTPKAFLEMGQQQLEKEIYSCGFYHNKAKNILAMSKDLVEKYDGKLPTNYDDMLSLAGVGRKTANVVFSILHHTNVIAVDTHVLRVSNRLGFCDTQDAYKCEMALTEKFKNNLDKLHFKMVLFGRYICKAKNPDCSRCKFTQDCKYFNQKT